MVDIKREDEKVWLDLDPYYPPKFKQPVTDFKAISITLKTMDSKLSYEHLMGISGTAFRFQLKELAKRSSVIKMLIFIIVLSMQGNALQNILVCWKKS